MATSPYTRNSSQEGSSVTPPQQHGAVSSRGNISGQPFNPGKDLGHRYTPSDWRYYAGANGNVTSPPNYPDVSFGAYLREGGNLLGIGYASWKDQRLAAYNTAYNMYQQYYDSTAQQVLRIADAGLNTNLAYGMATPGTSPGGALAQSSGPSPEQVFFGGIGAITGLATGTKALAEAAQIVNELPESKLKGNIARQIDSAAKAGAINAENSYLGSLYQARNALGVGASKAQQESANAAYQSAQDIASKNLLEYMTSHDAEGSESDFESSLFTQSGTAQRAQAIIDYQSKKAEWSNLLSNSKYWQARLDKLEADAYISHSQAWQARQILENPNMDAQSKFLALQPGLPGFFAKLSFSITDALIEGVHNTKKTIRGWFNKEERNP